MNEGVTAPEVLVGWTSSPDATTLATELAAGVLGRHPGPLLHHCPVCGGIDHGRPGFDAPISLSVAHAPRITVVAVTTGGPIGVDVEPLGGADTAWVRAEAVGKAYGVGITGRVGADAIVVDLDLPGYLAAVAVLAAEVPVIRMLPGAAATPGGPATH